MTESKALLFLIFNAVADVIPLMRARDRVGARPKIDTTTSSNDDKTSEAEEEKLCRVGPTKDDIDKYCIFFYNRALEMDHPLFIAAAENRIASDPRICSGWSRWPNANQSTAIAATG